MQNGGVAVLDSSGTTVHSIPAPWTVSVAVIPQGCVGVFPQWFLGVLF
jgi:hypothetical protein